jgi:5-hydroxyisourate hydrolase-like protein (transthyretin family)
MKWTIAFLLTFLIQIVAGAVQQPTETGGIEGLVVRLGSGEPISGVRVTLNTSAVVLTDKQGRFAFSKLRAGSYRLTFARNGYVRQELSRSLFAGQGVALTLPAGQTISGIVMQLTPTAVINGRVHEVGGAPLAGVQVELLRQTYDAAGTRITQRVGSASTNDHGEYRLFYVTPGRYILSASAATAVLPNQISPGVSPNPFARSFGATYHPGTPDPARAVVLDLAPGMELDGIDVTVRPRTFTIRGQVLGGAIQGMGLTVLRMTTSGGLAAIADQGPAFGRSYNSATGAFELRNLQPGLYVIIVTGAELAAFVPVNVEESDVNGLNISLAPRISIRGVFKPDRPEVANVVGYNRIRVELRPIAEGIPAPLRAAAEATFTTDNDFVISNLLPTDYRLSVRALPSGLYVKEARLNNGDALNRPLTNIRSLDQLYLVVAADSGQIDGVVRDASGRPAPAVPVALIPASALRLDLYKDVITDINGIFRLTNVPPGDYTLLALEEIEPYAWFDRELTDRLKPRGRALRVEGSSQNSVELQLIPNSR